MVIDFILISIHLPLVLPLGLSLRQQIKEKEIVKVSAMNNIYLSILVSLTSFWLWISFTQVHVLHIDSSTSATWNLP